MGAYQRVMDQARVEPARVDPLADGSHAFGFDKPRPDYAAERTARLNRLEAQAPHSAAVAPASADAPSTQYSPE